ncbi:hypothetical protein T310_10177, partial [Rasamsonia emersonii CBS 393.64]
VNMIYFILKYSEGVSLPQKPIELREEHQNQHIQKTRLLNASFNSERPLGPEKPPWIPPISMVVVLFTRHPRQTATRQASSRSSWRYQTPQPQADGIFQGP